MTPHEFVKKWKNTALTERSAAQQHFLDLCKLVDHPTPVEIDPKGEFFTFEKGVGKTGGGGGFADVWKKGHFAWEYKKKKRDLGEALKQLTQYAAALENPPLHIVSDTVRIRIETRWTSTVVEAREFELADIGEPANMRWLKAAFHNPDEIKPRLTRASLTEKAAAQFQTISAKLQHRHADREAVAHFVNQLVFCFFANSVKLLPEGLLKKLLETCERRPAKSKDYFDKLFAEMEKGGEFDLTEIKHFNGGLFDGRRALPLEHGEIQLLFALHSFRWDLIDPTIFGTLFERFLDPDKRAQIGAHYTDTDKIRMIVEPVVMRPLKADWQKTHAEIAALMGAAGTAGKAFEAARAKAEDLRDGFVDRLRAIRILDPACGSGNFLYVALQAVKDLEFRALNECEALGLRKALPRVGPNILLGIEINPFAAELARTVIWIGDIQWGIQNGFLHRPEPILEKLDTIECRDALVDWSGGEPKEADWPDADFIVGNPPFLGGKKLRGGLGDAYVAALFSLYDGDVPREADLVCYWFHRARIEMQRDGSKAFGLVSTNSIRGGKNRALLEPLAKAGLIFEAWADEPWVVDGAAVRVSLVCCGEADGKRLDGAEVPAINSDLSGAAADVTLAKRLKENVNQSFIGDQKSGPFEIPFELANVWLSAPINVNGRPNSDVIAPWANGLDVVRRVRNIWIVDFGWTMIKSEASLYESPFSWVSLKVKPDRIQNNRSRTANLWWQHSEPRPSLRIAISALSKTEKKRYLVIPRVAKHFIAAWLPTEFVPDCQLVAIARDDDTAFGILHSRFHEAWSLRLGTSLEDRPRYTPTTTFETFPFPEGLTPNVPAADYAADPRAIRIAAAAKRLDELRRNWLNPPDLGDWVPEIVPTAAPGEAPRKYPDRFLAKNAEAALKLKERTLTNLYNQRPQWLADAHTALDRAVAAAYGWPEAIDTDEALAKLLALNLERAAAGR